MSLTIKNQLVRSRRRTSAGTNPARYITIHETANTSRGANAQAHANLLSRNDNPNDDNGHNATWHITVDDRQAIRHYPDTVRCWHAGDGTGPGNFESIGIEVCVNSDGDYDQALANAAEVVRQLREKHDIPRSRVVQHNRWTGKACPRVLRGRGNKAWADFVASTDPGTSRTPSRTSGSGGGGGSTSGKTIAQLAQEVIDGKHGNGDARRRSLGSQYAAVQAEVNRRLTGSTSSGSSAPARTSGKTIGQLAQEVINGHWGNGETRTRRLTAAGHDAAAVQAEVNRRLTGSTGSSRPRGKTVGQLAQEVIRGDWGNGAERTRRLRAAGHDPQAVQAEVNRRLR